MIERWITWVERAEPYMGSDQFRARLDAVLSDGRRLVVLDDRGWGGTPSPPDRDELAGTARMVVGPDEPPPGRSHAEEERLHSLFLAGQLAAHGVDVDADALAALPHDVEFGPALSAELAR